MIPKADLKLHRLLIDSAERAPNSLAYGPVDYCELTARAARIAGTLRSGGLRRGARVALALDGCVEYLVGYYGVLMAGGTVVPLGPGMRSGGLAYVLDHSGSEGLIARGALLGQLAEGDPPPKSLRLCLCVGEPGQASRGGVESIGFAAAERDGPELFDAGARGHELASISYTSGTTGVPKGVMLTHQNLVSNIRSILSYLALTSHDRVAMVLPYYYVYGNSVLHTHLAVGGSIVDAGTTAFPSRVLATIQSERCTGLSGVPSTFSSLLRVRDLPSYDLSSLRYATQAGGPMSPAMILRLRRALPTTDLFVMYGQTEAGARLSYVPPQNLDRKLGSIGVAIPGVRLSVVDSAGDVVQNGVVGEIVAEGPNVMAGYLGDPAGTARALRGGVLHTGDMGYMDADGYLYISGRNGEMICSGGHRVGPLEIENVITALPEVAACAVVGVADDSLGERVVAVVVLQEGESLDARSIQRTCLSALPRHKVPSEVHFTDELPHSDRGKLLRSVVRANLGSRPAGVARWVKDGRAAAEGCSVTATPSP